MLYMHTVLPAFEWLAFFFVYILIDLDFLSILVVCEKNEKKIKEKAYCDSASWLPRLTS